LFLDNPGGRRRPLGRRIDGPFPDIQSNGRQQSADGGKLREIVVGDDQHFREILSSFRHFRLDRLIRRERSHEAKMSGNGFRREAVEIVPIHPGYEVANDVLVQIRAEGQVGFG
jgi:hypothetical protein